MAPTKQAPTRQAITLKGSTSLVTEFFKYAANTYDVPHIFAFVKTNSHVHSILFQRGVYPADDFHMVKKYGQTVLVTQDLALENYLDKCVRISFQRVFPLTSKICVEFSNKSTVSI